MNKLFRSVLAPSKLKTRRIFLVQKVGDDVKDFAFVDCFHNFNYRKRLAEHPENVKVNKEN